MVRGQNFEDRGSCVIQIEYTPFYLSNAFCVNMLNIGYANQDGICIKHETAVL